MKVVAEYDMKICRDRKPLLLYRLPQVNKNLKMKRVRYKPQSKHLEMDLMLPRSNTALHSKKEGGAGNMITYESYGFSPSSDYWYGKIIRDKKMIVLRRIEYAYLFNPKFEHLDVKDKEQSIDGYQIRKAESREEQKHRKRNINFHVKKVDQEDFMVLDCTEGEMSEECEDTQHSDVVTRMKSAKMVEKSIFHAKVVNISELFYLYGDEDMVRIALSKFTYFKHGRYILSNMFYERSLHDVRDMIVSLFNEKEKILIKDVEPFIRNEYFLLDELCRREGRFFYLKGFRECEGPSVANLESDGISKIYAAVDKHQPCSIEAIERETLLDLGFIRSNISKANIVVLANGAFATYGGSDNRMKVLNLLVRKKSWKKADVIRIAQSEDFGNIEEFFDIFREYCSLKGSTWSIKEGDLGRPE